MRAYKGWTAAERTASLAKTKAAIARGELPARPPKCQECGQKRGILHWHNDDYSDPVKFLRGLCWRCHMVHHRLEHAREKGDLRTLAACEAYFAMVRAGVTYPAIYRMDFPRLNRELAALAPNAHDEERYA